LIFGKIYYYAHFESLQYALLSCMDDVTLRCWRETVKEFQMLLYTHMLKGDCERVSNASLFNDTYNSSTFTTQCEDRPLKLMQ